MSDVKQLSIVEYMGQESVSNNIKDTLGKKTPQFIASVASLVNANATLAKAERKSVLLACLTAASLDLPINQNLGFAYIIPYKGMAQFQMGYKGFIQLAMRSGQFKTINVSDVREGEITGKDRLTGEIQFDWKEEGRDKLAVVGYVAFMRLINGFEKSLYMTTDELNAHGRRYSQTMKQGFGLWKEDFDAMASKTVIKLLLAKYAPMTVEMQKATLADQSVVTEEGYNYIDNQPPKAEDVAAEKERKHVIKKIEAATTVEQLEECLEYIVEDDVKAMYEAKLQLLTKKEVK